MRYEKHALCAALIALSSARIFGDVEVMASEKYVDDSVYAARTNLEEQIGIAYSSSTNYADVVKTNLEEQIGVAYSNSTAYADVVLTNACEYTHAAESRVNESLSSVSSGLTNYIDSAVRGLNADMSDLSHDLTNYVYSVKEGLEDDIDNLEIDLKGYVDGRVSNFDDKIDDAVGDAAEYTDSVASRLSSKIEIASLDATNYTYTVKTNLEDQISHISPSSAQTNSIAMFVLQVQNEDSIDFYGFELKCSTNNFDSAEFWSHSSYLEDPSTDGMRMFITGMNLDRRKLTEIGNYGMSSYYAQKLVVVLVSVDECRRTDGKWLYEGNDDLMWIWIRATADGREVAPGSDDELWRPVAPVKWFSRLPSWAR